MSQKSVIVVTNLWSAEMTNRKSESMDQDVFATLQDACDHFGYKYNTLCRKGDSFRHKDYLFQRKQIRRSGGEEKRKEKD